MKNMMFNEWMIVPRKHYRLYPIIRNLQNFRRILNQLQRFSDSKHDYRKSTEYHFTTSISSFLLIMNKANVQQEDIKSW